MMRAARFRPAPTFRSVLHFSLLSLGLCVLFAGCGSKEEPTSHSTQPAPSTAAPTRTASATPPPVPTGPADLAKKTWTQDGVTTPLVMNDLGKTCFVKGAQLLLPEKAKLSPAGGSRSCIVRGWGEDGPYMIVLSDEIPFKFTPKEELKDIKRFFDETADSWLAEEMDPKKGFTGRLTRKMGAYTYTCVVNSNGKPNGEQWARGMMQLCTTLSEPPKP